RPAFTGTLDGGGEWRAETLNVRSREHDGHAGGGLSRNSGNRADAGVGVGRAQNGGVQGRGRDRKVVDEAATAGEQRGILHALDRATHEWLRRDRHFPVLLPCARAISTCKGCHRLGANASPGSRLSPMARSQTHELTPERWPELRFLRA